jgi:hypothetical protein
MATEGSVYQRKNGRWVAQYRDAKVKVRYVYTKTKAEAKKALREAEVLSNVADRPSITRRPSAPRPLLRFPRPTLRLRTSHRL